MELAGHSLRGVADDAALPSVWPSRACHNTDVFIAVPHTLCRVGYFSGSALAPLDARRSAVRHRADNPRHAVGDSPAAVCNTVVFAGQHGGQAGTYGGVVAAPCARRRSGYAGWHYVDRGASVSHRVH